MGQISSNTTKTVNGVTNFSIGSDAYSWANGFYNVSVYSDNVVTATFNLSGSDWGFGLLSVLGRTKVVINDSATGGNRYIGIVDLANEGGNVVTLNKTSVDMFKGSSGTDKITTGAVYVGTIALQGGDDAVITGKGYVEIIDVGSGRNTVQISAGGDGVGYIRSGQDADRVTTLGETEVGIISTGSGADRIVTSGYSDFIDSGRGKDVVSLGAGGAQLVNLGRDADTVIVHATDSFVTIDGGGNVSTAADLDSDTVDFSALVARIEVNLLNDGGVVQTGEGYFKLINIENVIGSGNNDTLFGSNEVNIFSGNAGNDRLFGGLGADDLTGGAGADRFLFESVKDSTVATAGRDTIFDFSGTAGDRIDLSVIDASSLLSGNQAFKFTGTAAFTGQAGDLRYVKQASDTYIYGDVNGDKTADFAIHLDDAVTLSKDFFIL
ncbi:putative secreted protein (type I secretion substrate) [Rhizobium sp. PP-F2F-G48]|uniref:M10 family metallopeptidase C-terminal domain-containing protein n=1 Tax=Rhizobium sp. PP-F2F-G48 TaxID=2135651 RepID=UPI0010D84235|nr:hypothetical protein [Rhizobium sp. PP-F2F-G48]TCM57602.1 putative secreted protein (type I secretion substrate) [Rhizobium sp. PP-F2F-G48]